MLTLEDARFYVDPIVSHLSLATKVLVLDTRSRARQEEYIGKVVDVRKDRYYADGKAWAVTADGGNYVYGSPLLTQNSDIGINQPCVSLTEKGFMVGIRGSHNAGQLSVRNPRYSVRSPMSSVDPSGMYHSEHFVDSVLPAASWAYELMPEATDSDDIINAKLDLAKENYRQRRAFIHLHQQSVSRGWQDIMNELRELNDLIPPATYGIRVNATVFMPSNDLPQSDRDRLTEAAVASLSERNNVSAAPRGTQVGSTVRVDFAVPGTFATPNEVYEVNDQVIRSRWDDLSGYSGSIVSQEKISIVSGLAL